LVDQGWVEKTRGLETGKKKIDGHAKRRKNKKKRKLKSRNFQID